jgi:formylglycine-generating enzyme required for sulfatase activity
LRDRAVEDFFLDKTEVTNGQYAAIRHGVPARGKNEPPPGSDEDNYAVLWVPFGDAMFVAEMMGKRLPDEFEFLYAATNGGTTKYPWGEDPPPAWAGVVHFGPVGEFQADKSLTNRTVVGLFSNAAEWTSTSPTAELAESPPGQDPLRSIVKGAPASAVEGVEPTPQQLNAGPALRIPELRTDNFKPGLSFRCVRSARPRYLAPR